MRKSIIQLKSHGTRYNKYNMSRNEYPGANWFEIQNNPKILSDNPFAGLHFKFLPQTVSTRKSRKILENLSISYQFIKLNPP